MNGQIAPPPPPLPPPPPSPPALMESQDHQYRVLMHPTFFWGKNVEILFSGWPGTRTDMYVLSLVFVFVVSAFVEMLSYSQTIIKSSPGNKLRWGGAAETLLHGLRLGLSYMLILALMSFNAGVFIVAVVGHCVGFFLFGSRVVRNMSPAAQRIPAAAPPPPPPPPDLPC